jgi:hypothetical protein
MRRRNGVLAGLAALLVLIAASTAAQAATCETRKLWEREFAYIDKISTTCRILTTAAEVGVAVYVPYPSIVAELGGGLAGQVLHYASALGVNLQTVSFDKHHICRLVRAGQALHRQTHSGVKRRLLQYGLCRPTDDACKVRVRAVIFQRYGLPANCPQA